LYANRFSLCLLSFLFFSAFLGFGCGKEGKLVNSAPSNLRLSADKIYVEAGGTVRLVASATDDDGDSLIFSWKAMSGSGQAGSFNPPSASGLAVTWTAPNQPGSVTVTMSVTDEIEKRSKSQKIEVCVPFPSPIPESTTIQDVGHTYIITGDEPLRIGESVTLTISPGVSIVVASANGGFEVYGRITAAGTSRSNVQMSGSASVQANTVKTIPWNRIDIAGRAGRGVFRHALISDASGGIIAEAQASITIDSCDVFGNADYGVSVLDGSSATIHASEIWDNGVGVYVINSQVDIRETSIRYSSNGLELSSSQRGYAMIFENCEIANHMLDCIVLKGMAWPMIHHCSIFSSGEIQDGGRHYAMRLFGDYSGADSVRAENNFWGIGDTTEAKIASLIYDKEDNPNIGAYVSFSPWLESPPASQGNAGGREVKGRAWARSWR
jgi:hypothetical protein